MDNDDEEEKGQAANDYEWSMDEDDIESSKEEEEKENRIDPNRFKKSKSDTSGKVGNEAVKETRNEAAKEASKEVAKESAKEIAKGGVVETAGTAGAAGAGIAGAPIILIVVAVILIIILIVGLFGFLVYSPSLVRDKLKQKVTEFFDWLQGYIIGYDEAIVNDEQLVQVSQYLEDMGYDLVGYGFATDVEYDKDDKTMITKVESPYLKECLAAENRTYLISNDTFNLKDMLQAIGTPNKWGDSPGSAWGAGMIHIDDGIWDDLQLSGIKLARDIINEFTNKISIDRESNTLMVKRLDAGWDFWNNHTDTMYYNLDGWAGRYGKPFELLLTLHMATMAPDLVSEFASNPELDTKVNIKTKDIDFITDHIEVTINGENKNIYSKLDIDTMEQKTDTDGNPIYDKSTIDFLRNVLKQSQEIKTKDIYITTVEHHWFKDVYFEDAEKGINVYESAEDSSQEDEFEYMGDLSSQPQISSISIVGDRQSGMKQVKDGVRGETNKTTKELFNKKYYIYDGSRETANAIAKDKNAAIKDESLKQKISMDKNSLTAFSILEQIDTADAQLIYRDLKELVIELKYFDEEDFKDIEKCLEWPIANYEPIEWPYIKWEKQFTEYGTLMRSKSSIDKLKESEEDTTSNENSKIPEGFSAGEDFTAMAKSKVIEVLGEKNEYTDVLAEGVNISGGGVKLQITSNKEQINGCTLIIFGIDVASNIKEGTELEADDVIGTTTDGDICLILLDKNRAVISDIEKYIKVPEVIIPESTGTVSGPLSITGSDAEEKVWNALKSAGYSDVAIAAAMGNIYGESSFNSGTIEAGSGVGFGLCQWSYGRRTALENFAKSRGVSASDVDLQIEFLVAELSPGGGADGYAKYQFSGNEDKRNIWMTSNDIGDATTAFCAGFERPRVPRNEVRIEAAKRYYEKFTNKN